jgi:hypothetical protein
VNEITAVFLVTIQLYADKRQNGSNSYVKETTKNTDEAKTQATHSFIFLTQNDQ